MASTMEQGLEEVRALVTRFNHDAESYRKSSYPGANLRDDFLEPLFETLGWDMKNALSRAVSRRAVVVEQNTNAGRPDYTFIRLYPLVQIVPRNDQDSESSELLQRGERVLSTVRTKGMSNQSRNVRLGP